MTRRLILGEATITQYFTRRHTHEVPSPAKGMPGSSTDPSTPVPPPSTPGKWFGKKKTTSARKRSQVRTKMEFAETSPVKFREFGGAF